MQLYCPTCRLTITNTERCPSCGERLVTPAELFSLAPHAHEEPPELIRPSAFSRVLIGSVIAFGVFLGLHQWVMVGLGSFPLCADWHHLGLTFLIVALRLIAVGLGGLFAGSGQVGGTSTGAIVGFLCGGLFFLIDVEDPLAIKLNDGLLLVSMGLLGAISGRVGEHIWPAAVDLPEPLPDPRGSSLAKLVEDEKIRVARRPTAWFRVIVCTAALVAGFVCVDAARNQVKLTAGQVLNMGSAVHAPIVDLEFACVVLAVVGITVGAGTGAGLRHGVLMGVPAGVLAVALAPVSPSIQLITEGIHTAFGVSFANADSQMIKLRLVTVIFTGCALSGWLGGQMFPPLVPVRRLRVMD